jgi:hypothetical protein
MSGDERSRVGRLLVGLALERRAEVSTTSSGGEHIEELIARRIQEISGDQDFDLEEISDYLHGERWPEAEFIRAFVEAFSLTARERRLLAWAYTFSESPPTQMEGRPPPSPMVGEGD